MHESGLVEAPARATRGPAVARATRSRRRRARGRGLDARVIRALAWDERLDVAVGRACERERERERRGLPLRRDVASD